MIDYTTVGIHDFYCFLLVFARVGGLMVAAPLFSNPAIPKMSRAGFAVMFSLAATPLLLHTVGAVPTHLFLLAGYVIKDALYGIALGYTARILFSSVELAGYFIDTQIGFGMINLLNPYSQQQSSVMSLFQYQLATTLYLLANGHLTLLGALVDSFASLPPGGEAPHAAMGLAIVPVVKSMFIIGFRIALPAAGVLIAVDMAFGLIARMAPQVNVSIVGGPLKIIVGLATVALMLPLLTVFVGHIISGTSAGFQGMIAGAHH